MRVLIATDAWRPQVNGVVRTLESLAAAARGLGIDVEFLSPAGFWSVAMPTYASLRLAIPKFSEIVRRIESCKPDSIHIATEGPIGLMVRAYCVRRRLNFTTSYTTRFPGIYFGADRDPGIVELRGSAPVPCRGLRHHGVHAVARRRTGAARLQRISACGRAVSNTDVFTPADPFAISTSPARSSCRVGRIAVEKNLEAFLSLDLPGSKVVIGDGPQEAELQEPLSRGAFPRREGRQSAGLAPRGAPTSSCFQASPTRSASCSSRRSRAARRSRRFR